MVWALLDTLRGRFDILAFAREFGTLGIIDHHVSRASSARGKDILLDGGGDEVLWCGDDFPGVFGGVDISWIVRISVSMTWICRKEGKKRERKGSYPRLHGRGRCCDLPCSFCSIWWEYFCDRPRDGMATISHSF